MFVEIGEFADAAVEGVGGFGGSGGVLGDVSDGLFGQLRVCVGAGAYVEHVPLGQPLLLAQLSELMTTASGGERHEPPSTSAGLRRRVQLLHQDLPVL